MILRERCRKIQRKGKIQRNLRILRVLGFVRARWLALLFNKGLLRPTPWDLAGFYMLGSRSPPLGANNKQGNKSIRKFHLVINAIKTIKSKVMGQ